MKKTLLLGFLFFSLQLKSQSTGSPVAPTTLNIGGGSAAITPSFIVDWSIGESAIIDTYYGQSWNVTSGVLQPFDKDHIIFNPLIPNWSSEEIRVYPVPTKDNVFIDFRSVTTGKISIQLLSIDGNLLGTREFMQMDGKSVQTWNLTNKTSGIYYFRILLSSDQGRILKQSAFKIEKVK